MPVQRSAIAALAHACRAAAQAAARYVAGCAADHPTLAWEVKARADFVSAVDRGAEARIAAVLEAAFPGATIVGEELSPEAVSDTGLAFIVDPLDGTTNYLHGYPQYAVSIAAVRDGEILAGVVHDIARDVVWHASRDGGAWCNDQPIRVSTIAEPLRALIGTGFPFKHPEHLPRYLTQFSTVVQATAGVRRAGAAALDLADVAAGRFDGFWELQLAPWDMAAGILLVREAGGRVTDLDGRDLVPAHAPVVASNGVLHDWLLECLRAPSALPAPPHS